LSAMVIQDLIQRRFGVEYRPCYIYTVLHNLGEALSDTKRDCKLRR
jgi:hypothetical protein